MNSFLTENIDLVERGIFLTQQMKPSSSLTILTSILREPNYSIMKDDTQKLQKHTYLKAVLLKRWECSYLIWTIPSVPAAR